MLSPTPLLLFYLCDLLGSFVWVYFPYLASVPRRAFAFPECRLCWSARGPWPVIRLCGVGVVTEVCVHTDSPRLRCAL